VGAPGVSAGGFPYLLVDRVLECEAGVRALAAKLVSANEPYFVGHFPGVPVVPGVILCEALVQVGRLVAGGDEALQLTTVERARFRKPVQPGDALALEVRARQDGPPWRMRGVVRDGDTGLLVPPSDPGALAGAILRLAAAPDLGFALSQRASRRVRELFSSERMVDAYARLYRELIA